MARETAVTAARPPGLRRDAIGLREVLFQSITDMAPGGGDRRHDAGRRRLRGRGAALGAPRV